MSPGSFDWSGLKGAFVGGAFTLQRFCRCFVFEPLQIFGGCRCESSRLSGHCAECCAKVPDRVLQFPNSCEYRIQHSRMEGLHGMILASISRAAISAIVSIAFQATLSFL